MWVWEVGFCGGVWFDLACGHGGGDNCVVVMVVVRLPFLILGWGLWCWQVGEF